MLVDATEDKRERKLNWTVRKDNCGKLRIITDNIQINGYFNSQHVESKKFAHPQEIMEYLNTIESGLSEGNHDHQLVYTLDDTHDILYKNTLKLLLGWFNHTHPDRTSEFGISVHSSLGDNNTLLISCTVCAGTDTFTRMDICVPEGAWELAGLN